VENTSLVIGMPHIALIVPTLQSGVQPYLEYLLLIVAFG